MAVAEKGISYLVDDKGHKESIVIPLHLLNSGELEDLFDALIARDRLENDTFEPLT